MIINLIVSMVGGLVTGIFSLIPAWGVSTSVLDPVKQMSVSAASLDGWIPETFIFGCLLLLVGARLFFLVLDGVQWIYHLIPFNGG